MPGRVRVYGSTVGGGRQLPTRFAGGPGRAPPPGGVRRAPLPTIPGWVLDESIACLSDRAFKLLMVSISLTHQRGSPFLAGAQYVTEEAGLSWRRGHVARAAAVELASKRASGRRTAFLLPVHDARCNFCVDGLPERACVTDIRISKSSVRALRRGAGPETLADVRYALRRYGCLLLLGPVRPLRPGRRSGFTTWLRRSGEWDRILDRYGRGCLACGAVVGLEPDHVVPIAAGGPDAIENIQPLCARCNRRKGANTIDYRGPSV